MKINLAKTMVAAFVLACCSICVSSCGKDDPQPVIEYDATFYLGVNPGDSDEACIYKDDELLYRLGSVSWVEGIALTPDGSRIAGFKDEGGLIFGVQFHPEIMFAVGGNSKFLKIFEMFVEEARKYSVK